MWVTRLGKYFISLSRVTFLQCYSGGNNMQVNISQLIPGCILIKEIRGKSNKPFILKDTVLTEQHITVLQKFLVESVHVSSKLVEGESFVPKLIHKKVEKQQTNIHQKDKRKKLLFQDHYRLVVAGYKKEFEKWRNGMAVDMLTVRKLFIPLLERIEDIGSAVFTLHHYATKHDYFYHHSVTVGIISAFLGKKMGFEKGEWLQIGLAGLLSDCGMTRIDLNIVKKDSSLTAAELDEIKKHPTYSYRIIEKLRAITQPVKLAVLQHHERIDGSGYPLGLSQENIHMYARIVGVSDIYHAMTSDRLYKQRQSPFRVMEEIQREQFSKLDPQVVSTFIESLSDFSIGTKVRLSDDRMGKIIFIDAKKPTRPMVQIMTNEEIIALQSTPELFIDEILME